MGGSLLSPNYVLEPVSSTDMKIACIAWGFTLGFGYLTAAKALGQTIAIWHRSRRVFVSYVWMVWIEVFVNIIYSITCWLYLNRNISPSIYYYVAMVTLWALQVQLLLQIIINRIALLMIDQRHASRIKWGTAALITTINISVYCIWVPARLQISDKYIHINNIWDRIEKSIYLIVDGALNGYFIYLVQSKLVSQGLTKYRPLFRFNLGIVFVSLAMDVMIIATMSLQNTFVYMQFHPVAYIVKLNIEMTMAQLISKLVRKADRVDAPHSSSREATEMHASRLRDETTAGNRRNSHSFAKHASFRPGRSNIIATAVHEIDDIEIEDGLGPRSKEQRPRDGIMKTVATVVSSKSMESEMGSDASSTRDLY